MAKRNEATKLLEKGMSLDEVADKMGVSFQTIVRYMKLQVAEGALKVSQVFFGLKPSRRELLEHLLVTTGYPTTGSTKQYYSAAHEAGISWDEANLYWSLRDARISRGDMYEQISDLEVELHSLVRRTLESEFGEGEMGWWRQGVPASVRKSCVQVREDDPEPATDIFAYTTFINLSEIIERNWSLFISQLPQSRVSNRKMLLSDFSRLNQIRNAVMHPVKSKRWDQSDFFFVQEFLGDLMKVIGRDVTYGKALQQTVRFAKRKKEPRPDVAS